MALTKEQLAARKIGGSMVATILGLDPHKSQVELYHEIRGTIEREDLSENTAVEAGTVLEDGIAELAQRHMARFWNKPVKLRRCNLTLSHPEYPWLTCHIDRDVVGEERGVELKNVGMRAAKGWGMPFTDEIPDHYMPQPMTYMLVKGYPVWTVAGYFGGADLRLYEIARDKEWDEIIVERTHDFWHNHVLAGVPPPIDLDGPRALEIVKRIYKGTTGVIVQAGEDLDHWRQVFEQASKKAKEYGDLAEGAKAHMLDALGDGAILDFGSTKLERKQVTRKAYSVAETTYFDARFKKVKE